MVRRLLVLLATCTNSILLVIMLSLGSQNLRQKHSLFLGISSTEEYPTGFLIGISIALGAISGGLTSCLLTPSKSNDSF